MALRVYNSLTRQKEEFTPINPKKVGMYVCGVTVYDLSHIGHARCYIAFDIVYRYLKYLGNDVTYVRNFTDIDDKIIRRSQETERPHGELTETFIQAFHEDMEALGVLPPDEEPRCTAYIPQMVTFIQELIDEGFAYAAENGDVYYRVNRFEGYGKLSGKRLEDLLDGARVEVNSVKESPADFVLWKAAKPGEPEWDSPWGKGRPGWHIECSVMSSHNLGETIDIHAGGKDLIFPHHENEIAQSEAHNHKPFANYWLHNGFVNVPDEHGEATKMSKSLGNFFTIRDVLAAFHPQTVKFFMMSTHYRNDVLFAEKGLEEAEKRLIYFYETMKKARAFVEETKELGQVIQPESIESVETAFRQAMDDDFNTQRAFGQLSAVFKKLNDLINKPKASEANRAATTQALLEKLATVANVLGVFDLDPERFLRDIQLRQLRDLTITADEIDEQIILRKQARDNKDWAKSDEIRDALLAQGILLKDGPEGTTWTVKA